MFPKICQRVLLSAFFALGMTACEETPADPMRVGLSVWPGYEPAFIAQNLGYLSGLDVRLNQFHSATETIRAFRNGVIDVATLTLDETLLLAQGGMDIQVFLLADVSMGGDVIIGQPGVDNMQDLKGGVVGVESSALGAYVLSRALEIHGVPLGDVTVQPMQVDEAEQAFMKNTVDAVVTFEPYRSRLLSNGGVELFSSREIPNEIVDVLVTRREFAQKNADMVKAFSAAWFRAVNFVQENPEEAASVISSRLGLSAKEAQNSFVGLRLLDKQANINMLKGEAYTDLIGNATRLNDVLMEKGLLNEPVNAETLFTDIYVD